MQSILDQYISNLETGSRSQETIRTYKKDLKKLFDFIGDSTIEKIKSLTVSDFHSFYETQSKLEKSSFNGLLRSLSAFFNWLKYSGYIEDSDFFKIRFGKSRLVKEPKVKRLVLTDVEKENIILAGENIQERFMLALMFKTALRRSEVCNIKISDINGCDILIHGKGGEEEFTYLNKTLCTMLNLYLAQRKSDSEYLFYGVHGQKSKSGKMNSNSVNNRIKACAIRSGMSKERAEQVSSHTARRTSITHMYVKRGAGAAQGLGRHKSFQTTNRYINIGQEMIKDLLLDDDD